MFGQTNFQSQFVTYAITAVSIAAFATDIVVGRIFNWLTFPAILAAMVFAFYFMGWAGLGQALLGAVCGLVLFGWIFALGFIGGGDVKFLMALGAWGGFKFAGQVALISILLGGVMALFVLIYKKRALDFFLRMQMFVSSLVVKNAAIQKPEIDQKLQMPFGIPMAIAALLLAWGAPVWFL